MRKISAQYIFDGKGMFYKNGLLILSDEGEVLDLIDTDGVVKELSSLEYYNGIICPGFVNAHCHLELSHLMNKYEKTQGLANFISSVSKDRNFPQEEIQEAMIQADRRMLDQGIVAVGDISNTIQSISVKKKSRIKYVNFIELLGLDPGNAGVIMKKGLDSLKEFKLAGLDADLSPHSPYSLSDELFAHFAKELHHHSAIVSMHNQESEAENLMFRQGSGSLWEVLKKFVPGEWKFKAGRGSSLMYAWNYLRGISKVLLVHNTYTAEEDIEFILDDAHQGRVFFVFCPASNLFIEDRLPDYSLFQGLNEHLCLGTDSLASNEDLSMLHEMKTIQEHAGIPLRDLLSWSCFNGAKALGIDKKYGSFEKGSAPGVNLMEGLDLANLRLTDKTCVKVLL